MSMPLQTLLDALFPHGHAIAVSDSVLTGSATTDNGDVTVIGTANKLGWAWTTHWHWPRRCWPAPPRIRSNRS